MNMIYLAIIITIPFLFSTRIFLSSFYFKINYTNHTGILHYLSQPENFPSLNPTIFKLQVISKNEKGLTIEYEECLSHFRFITNTGFAHYMVKHINDEYELASTHSTCFVGKNFCLQTTSAVRLKKTKDSGVIYEEDIQYGCPWILSAFCFREVLFQRTAIMNRIEEMFSYHKP